MPKIEVKNISRQEGRVDRPRRRRLRRRGPRAPPVGGREVAARQAPRRHRLDQAPRRGARLGEEGLEAEGHRPGAPGQPPGAALGRRRLGVRAPSRAATSTPCRARRKKAALRAALSLRASRAASSSCSTASRTDGKTKSVAARAGGARAPQPTQGADRRRQGPTSTLVRGARNLAASQWLAPEGLNVYDILRHETLVLTQEALHVDHVGARSASQRRRPLMRSRAAHHQAPAPHREERAPPRDRWRRRGAGRGRGATPRRSCSRSPATRTRSRSAARSQKLFKVTVTDVRTLVVRGKVKRVGRFSGQRPAWKKAFVTLKPGDNIEFFEGV